MSRYDPHQPEYPHTPGFERRPPGQDYHPPMNRPPTPDELDNPRGTAQGSFGHGYDIAGGYEQSDAYRFAGAREYADRFNRARDQYFGPAGAPAPGPHVGKGPKGYQRSDDRIREDACEMLYHDGAVDATDIDVQVQNGEITLTGTVPDRWTKVLAEKVVENVPGVHDVHNQLRIAPQQSHNPPAT